MLNSKVYKYKLDGMNQYVVQVYLQVYSEKSLFQRQFLNISLSKHIRVNNAQKAR